ncbi:MAG: type II toxin-antitoxin system RelB/DinJ family antitoxin [Clostridiales bacterium]|nr:type II toxin-antitoxin system RelB/DinJ family antitoxin [Clostridiales bacterium]
MANTTAVYARIDTNLKESAEGILSQLGISPSSAIQMFYSQIVLNDGIPFDVRLPAKKPTAIGAMTREQLDAELAKGFADSKAGRTYTADEVDAELRERYGL